MGATIAVERLVKRFGSFTAVDGVGFEAPEGKITALLGPSGSGKSTVLRMIAGLERPTAGRITLAGEDQTLAAVQERRVGFVFQHYALFRHMTVRQNVAFGLSVRKEPKATVRSRVDELLDLVHLPPGAVRGAVPAQSVRRPAPASGPGPGPGSAPEGAVAGRAVRCPGRAGPP